MEAIWWTSEAEPNMKEAGSIGILFQKQIQLLPLIKRSLIYKSQNYVAAGISLALQWILINGPEGYLFSPFMGPRMSPMSLYFKDSVSIDTGLSNKRSLLFARLRILGLSACYLELVELINSVEIACFLEHKRIQVLMFPLEIPILPELSHSILSNRGEPMTRWLGSDLCEIKVGLNYSCLDLSHLFRGKGAFPPFSTRARRRFVEWAQNEIAVVPDFHKRILFSDEAHFWLNGYVNKQNCRTTSVCRNTVTSKKKKLTVWCALWAGGIIGPYFKNDEGDNVTVNGDRYRAMITNFFIPELNNHDVQELWFQQDGATCHTARATIDLLKDTFGDRLISRFGPVNWPPRSCDLTPLDYFLWGYVKSLVYADKPQTLDHLEDNIRRVIADIRPQMLEKVIENWTSRLDYIRASRGSPMPEIIFKM
ncbi:putative DD41D transposase [Trichonephila clavipes]|nr:putative DD41D transposase [Trichonephila clavipes]